MEIRTITLAIIISLTSAIAYECGTTTRNSGFIVFGNQFKHGDFPWIVALKYTGHNPPSFFCGGTLVSLQHVITAAHCVKPKYGEGGDFIELVPRDILALFGAYNLSNANEVGRITLSPEAVLVHSDWNPQVQSYDADIAVLRFAAGEITTKPSIKPICLWKSTSTPSATDGTVAGWGRSEDETKFHENIPRTLSIPIHSNDDCFLKTPGLASIASKRTFCAGLENGSGVCLGDSGNGFFIKSGESVFLRGVVSSSRTTATSCDVTKYAIYTDVLKFNGWISSIIGDDSNVDVIETRFINCFLENMNWPSIGKTARTCTIKDQTVESAYTAVQGSPNSDVQAFEMNNNKNVKFIPTNVPKMFRQLIAFQILGTSIARVNDQHFQTLEKLKLLDLSTNLIDVITPGAFRDLIDVETLKLHGNKIEVLPANLFENMESLQTLYLQNNKIRSLDESLFKSLTNLRTFWASSNKIQVIPRNLFSKNLLLEIISFDSNEIETLHDDTFKNLRELKSLFLVGNKIKALKSALFSSLQKLGEFFVYDNRIRRLDSNVFDSLTNIYSLNIGDNNVRNLDENIFAKLTKLSHLAMPNNRFTELSENQFKNNRQLTKLWLHGNEIKFLSTKMFENLTMLEYVDLQNNVCVGGFYQASQFTEMKNLIAKNCGRN